MKKRKEKIMKKVQLRTIRQPRKEIFIRTVAITKQNIKG